MKKLLIIGLLSLIIQFSSCSNKEDQLEQLQLSSKSIDLSLYKNISYNAPVYNGASASLQVTITKISGEKREIVWYHNYGPKRLKKYASNKMPGHEIIVIDNLNTATETLEVSYLLIYNIKGTLLNLSSDTLLENTKDSETIRIGV